MFVTVILLIFVALTILGYIELGENIIETPEQDWYPQEGELNLTVIPEKTRVQEGEIFDIHLTLKNVGNTTINVWEMEEQVSYDINFWLYIDNPAYKLKGYSLVDYKCPLIQRLPLRNEDLVELSPGESINDTRSSECWLLKKGEYILNASYHTFTGEDITIPYWLGRVQSNNVTVVVE